MSSFIVSDTTINRIVSYLARDKNCASWTMRRLREEQGYALLRQANRLLGYVINPILLG